MAYPKGLSGFRVDRKHYRDLLWIKVIMGNRTYMHRQLLNGVNGVKRHRKVGGSVHGHGLRRIFTYSTFSTDILVLQKYRSFTQNRII